MATPNSKMIADYNKAINALLTKSGRQQLALEATQAQIEGFRSLVAQLEGKK